MGVEERGSTYRVRTRWSSLQLALTMRDEKEAKDAFAALKWLRQFQRDDLLKEIGKRPALIIQLIAIKQANRLTARGLTLADLLPKKEEPTPTTMTVLEAGNRWVSALNNKLESNREREYRPKVVEAYERVWKEFVAWLNTGNRRGTATTVGDVDKALLLAWRQHVEQNEHEGRRRSRSTANRHLAVVSAWGTWVRSPQGLGLSLPDHRISVSKGEPRPLPRALSPEAVEKLFKALSPTDWIPLVTILAETGIRAQECLALKWSEVQLDLDALKLVEKQDRPLKTPAASREVPLSVAAKTILQQAYDTRGARDEYVWSPEKRNPNAFASAWKRAVKKAQLTARVHDLRHTRAVRWAVEEGVSEPEIRERLGHREASTTARYLTGANQYGRALARRASGPKVSPKGKKGTAHRTRRPAV